MALLGCGCCKCCAEGTSAWYEPFDTTPVVGPIWDEVSEVVGPSARSYAPSATSRATKKTSTLKLNCDSTSPMYLGYNGSPYGGWYEMQIDGYTDLLMWQLPVPASGNTQTGVMSVRYENELIFNFGSQEYRSGTGHYWEKRMRRNSTGVTVQVMLLEMYGYDIRNGNSRRTQRLRSSGYVPLSFLFSKPYWKCEYQFDAFGVVLDERTKRCEKLVERKWGLDWYFRQSDLLDGFRIPLAQGEPSIEMSKQSGQGYEKFQCRVGTETRIRWEATYTGPGKFTGNFDFAGGYSLWNYIDWHPSNT